MMVSRSRISPMRTSEMVGSTEGGGVSLLVRISASTRAAQSGHHAALGDGHGGDVIDQQVDVTRRVRGPR